mgnify:FL=1
MGKKRGPTKPSLMANAGELSADRQQQIARRAYELHVVRGCQHGRDLDDWLDAEREFAEAA